MYKSVPKSEKEDPQGISLSVIGNEKKANDPDDLESGRLLADFRRPKYCSVQFFKALKTTEIGLDVEKTKMGLWKVSSIDPSSPLHGSPIEVGDIIVKVNDTEFSSIKSTVSPVDHITAESGSITIIAEAQDQNSDPNMTAAMITKMNPSDKVGVLFSNQQNKDGDINVLIKTVRESGLFAKSKLSPGDKLISVNDIKGMGIRDVVEAVAASERRVTLVVEHSAKIGTTARRRDDLQDDEEEEEAVIATPVALPTVRGKIIANPDEARMDEKDFWTCCLMTFFVPCGCLCSFACLSDRPNGQTQPTSAAIRGFVVAFSIALVLRFLLLIIQLQAEQQY